MRASCSPAGARDMEAADPVFHSFFEINGIDHFPQADVR
jgi:hypothetical protein